MRHARLLQRVRPAFIAVVVVEHQKVSAQIAEGVQPVIIEPGAKVCGRENAPPARRARTRRVQDPSPAGHAVQAAKPASTRADAAQAQGPRSVLTAELTREVIAKRDPPTVAQRREPHARLGISALVELRTSNFARLLREDTVLLLPCQRKARCARQGSGAREVPTTRQPVPGARMLLRTGQRQ